MLNGDWDSALEWARAETGGADRWVLQRRGFPGVARVNKVTTESLGYPISVFNKNSTLNGIGGFHENLVTFERSKLPDFDGLKRCASKNAVLRCIKKSGQSGRFYTKRKSGGKPPQIWPSPKHNRSEFPYSCIFQEPMNRGKYAYMGLWVKYALGKSSCVSKIPPVQQKKRKITVSAFLRT